MPELSQRTRYGVKRFRREMFDLAVSIRDDAPSLVKRVYGRKARAYQPYIGPHALSRAKNGSGGPFGLLPAWLASLDLNELAEARAWVDAVFDRIEAEKCAKPICLTDAMIRQQEADTAEDLEESRAHLTGDYTKWRIAAQRTRAAMRVAEIAVQQARRA